MIDVILFPGISEDQCDLVVHEVLERTLPGSSLVEKYGRLLRFELVNAKSRLGPMFRLLEELKKSKRVAGKWHQRGLVADYIIRQCDLEQLFVKVVDEDGNGKNTMSRVEI